MERLEMMLGTKAEKEEVLVRMLEWLTGLKAMNDGLIGRGGN